EVIIRIEAFTVASFRPDGTIGELGPVFPQLSCAIGLELVPHFGALIAGCRDDDVHMIASGISGPHVPTADIGQSLELCFDALSLRFVEESDGGRRPLASPVCQFRFGRLWSLPSPPPSSLVSLQKRPIDCPGDEEGDRLVCTHIDAPDGSNV